MQDEQTIKSSGLCRKKNKPLARYKQTMPSMILIIIITYNARQTNNKFKRPMPQEEQTGLFSETNKQ